MNSAKIIARVSVWVKHNHDAARANKNRWAHKNKEAIRVKDQAYARNNPEKVKEFKRAWAKANPETIRNYTRNRRALRSAVGGVLSKGIAEHLFAEQEGRCVYCRTDLSIVQVHLDHRMPLKLGGTNSDDNVQLLCRKCNLRKGAKHPDDFERQIGYAPSTATHIATSVA